MPIQILLIALALFGLTATDGMAVIKERDIAKFKEYNPDGKKYEFVKTYIKSLNYLQNNAKRSQLNIPVRLKELGQASRIQAVNDDLNLDNVNLRIARNLLKRFHTPESGLILKATDLFQKVCDQQIAINNEERNYLNQMHELQLSGGLGPSDKETFSVQLNALASKRKESLKGLLESSLLVHTILMSENSDPNGEFTHLGITTHERSKLLALLNKNFGTTGRQGLKDGQSFLEGSIATVREILEDGTWQTADIVKK